ncbi:MULTISPECIES: thiamine diphosphokinase [unclassified Francisella]|uniref:thiamine diphosphokinase n=1 Tax=unclassified Francisella TaxID=2610885 RepID=UPI002E309295|nr:MULTISPECIES: thiamine diphosphokinase [unclassified Francisella]MED7819580.1 thiamine diphosphokinase [Francisella sp. 19S2-4]MED7830402.1 thiamine diphosphokinase [Francisella sp. 19S2-10]
MSQAILFLNGKVDLAFCEQYIQDNLCHLDIFCADGAYRKIIKSSQLSSKIKKVIGDFDSFTASNDELFLIDKDQYSTDFEKSLNYIISQGVSKVFVFGASEGEMDHFLCNISIAKNYIKRINIEFIDIYSRYFFIPNKFSISRVKGRMFSVMPFGSAEDIYYNGLRYPLSGESLSIDTSTGARNYATEDKVEISYSSGDILLFISHAKYKDRLNAIL